MANIDIIHRYYVAYMGRAGDPAGVNFWVTQANNGAPLSGIANSFSLVPESQALYSFLSAPLVGDPGVFLASIYLNSFNRVVAPNALELDYWKAQLASGVSVGNVISNITFGAQGNDMIVLQNKAAVSMAFAKQIVDTNAVFNLAQARSAFTGVTSDPTTVTTAINNNNTVISTSAGNAGGLTFNLTTSPDSPLAGPANDIFNGVVNTGVAASNTFTSTDNLDGSGGTGDILNALFETSVFPNATINNIEIFNIRNASGANVTFDSDLFAGDTLVNSDRSIVAGSTVTITNLATGAAAGLIGNGVAATTALSVGYKSAGATATVNVSGGTASGSGGITFTNTPGLVILNSTLAANTVGAIDVGAAAAALTINAATNLTTGVLTGAAVKTITATGAATTVSVGGATNGTAVLPVGVTSINGSALSAGGIATTLGANTTAFVGGGGNDTVSIANTGTTSLVFNGSVKLDAGAGTGDIFALNDQAGLTVATAPNILGFEIVRVFDDTAAGDVFTLSLLGTGLTGLQLAANTSSDTVSGISAAVAGNVTILGGVTNPVLNVTGATTVGQIDTLGFTISDGAPTTSTITVTDITAAGVEIVNFVATDNFVLSAATGLTALTNSTITGGGTVSITTGALALNVNTTINASGNTGGLTFDATAGTGNGISVTGSATKANTLTGTNLAAKSDSLTGGAGNDTISGLDGADTINGGDGNDSITGGLGGDIVNVGTGNDTLVFGVAGQTFSGAVTSGVTALAGVDVVSGAGASDAFSMYAATTITTATTIGTALIAAAGVTDAVAFVRGTFASGTGIFTVGAAGPDTLFQFDDNGTTAAGNINSVVLLGFTGTAAATANLLTLV